MAFQPFYSLVGRSLASTQFCFDAKRDGERKKRKRSVHMTIWRRNRQIVSIFKRNIGTVRAIRLCMYRATFIFQMYTTLRICLDCFYDVKGNSSFKAKFSWKLRAHSESEHHRGTKNMFTVYCVFSFGQTNYSNMFESFGGERDSSTKTKNFILFYLIYK